MTDPTTKLDTPATIFEEWTSYDRDVVPPEATAAQREECRRAFYAGAWACFCAVQAATEPADQAECDRNLDALQAEIQNVPQDLALERPRRTPQS